MSERDSPGCANCGHPFEAHCNAAAMQACRTCGCDVYSGKVAEHDSPDISSAAYWIQRLENDAECDCAVKQPCAVAAVLRDLRTALAAAEQELDAAHAKVSDLPVRVEYLGGQRTGYVQRDSVLAILESK